MLTRAVTAVLTAAAAGMLSAQEPADSVDPRPNRLFREEAPISVTITADYKQLFRDRDTTKTEILPARLAWQAPEGDSGEMAIGLETRGHSRLQSRVCDFPPLRVHLPEGDERPRLWRGQGDLKISVNCRPARKEYEQFVLQEYLIYRWYNLFTPLSYATRLARVTYIQEGADTLANTWSFFIEDADDMARRNGGEDFEVAGVRFRDVDSTAVALVGVFNYMVGNTDWALPVLHNIRIVKIPPGFYHTVPFDFDFSGIIKTPYAKPAEALGIRDVRDRLYRGPCVSMELLQATLAPFVLHRQAIYDSMDQLEGMDADRAKRAKEYLDDFYKTIQDPGDVNRAFRYNCG